MVFIEKQTARRRSNESGWGLLNIDTKFTDLLHSHNQLNQFDCYIYIMLKIVDYQLYFLWVLKKKKHENGRVMAAHM
jgi:hypothetical protein